MPDYREIARIRKDPGAFKGLAARLLNVTHKRWGDRRAKFLDDIANYRHAEITTRQCELLFRLRDSAERVSQIRGLSIALLVEQAYLARADLGDDEDVARVESLKRTGQGTISGLQAGWFKRICIELDLIERYM